MNDETIQALLHASEGSRTLDGQLASALGWRRKLERYVEPITGDARSRNFWIKPGEETPIVCPRLTSSFNAAYGLATDLLPRSCFACVWEDGKARVSIDNEKSVSYAATPALALCAAVLRALK
jgi:hypothetical protein